MVVEDGVNPVYSTVTQIKIGNRDDFGTGFFYNFLDETYLVTNKHLLAPSDTEDAEDAEDATEIRFFVRSYNRYTKLSWITVSLEDGVGEDWFEHDANHDLSYDIDLAVIPINQRLSDFSELINTDNPSVETGSLAFTPEMILQGDGIVSGGDVVLVVGYPDGLLDSNTYIPLLRDARISTPFGMAFEQEPKFITDAMMYPGMSGSPIVAGPRTLKNPATGGLRTSSRGFALLGVHSGNYERADGDRMERLNLNEGWYAKQINAIIMSMLFRESDNVEELREEIEQRHPDPLQLDDDVMKNLLNDLHPEL